MAGTRSYLKISTRNLMCVAVALLFSILIVLESYSADQNVFQGQEDQNEITPPIVFSNMSTITSGK